MQEAWDTFRPYAERAAQAKLRPEDAADYLTALDATWEAGGADAVTSFLEKSKTEPDFDADMAALWTQASGAEIRRAAEADTYDVGAYAAAVAEDAARVANALADVGEGVISAAEGAGAALDKAGDAAKENPGAGAVVLTVVVLTALAGLGLWAGRKAGAW